MLEQLTKTTEYLNSITNNFTPDVGVILGSGLGKLSDHISVQYAVAYEDIPHFPVSTVEGHKGQLLFGTLGGKNVVVMQGRFHFYEGYTMQELAFPIRTLKYLGIQQLIVSNAAGGMNPAFEIGDIMLINDHINCFPDNPLMGPNNEAFGPRFPDMSQVYSKKLIRKAHEIGNTLGLTLHEGVYVGVSGPCFETPAEYKYFRVIGGDAVGMSTVPEIIVAHHMGIECFGVSVITDLGIEGQVHEVSHAFVQEQAERQTEKMSNLVKQLIAAQ